MAFFSAIVALDARFLRDLNRFRGLGERRLSRGGAWHRLRLRSWGVGHRCRTQFGRVLPDPNLLPLDLFLLIGRPRFEPHVILSTAALVVAPLWCTIAVPISAELPLPPAALFFCTLAEHALEPVPIVGVKVLKGPLGSYPGLAMASVHRRRGSFSDEARERGWRSRSTPPTHNVREGGGEGRNGI
jgi:hypothetical protein